jgi:hypothetical protein
MSHSPKRKPTEDPRQLSLVLEVPPRMDTTPGALAGLDRRISGLISRVLKEHIDPRAVIAGRMSALLDEDVSKSMLDQYAAPSSEAHNISAARLLALVAATHRHDLLDVLVMPLGCRVLEGEEVIAAQLGSVEARIRELSEERKRLQARVTPIRGQSS